MTDCEGCSHVNEKYINSECSGCTRNSAIHYTEDDDNYEDEDCIVK